MKEPSIEDLILAGAIEVSAMDPETGEFLYSFTPKIKDVMPDLYHMHINNIHSEIMFFFERGFVDIIDFESSNPVIKLTQRAFDPEYISKLDPEYIQSLNEIKRILKVV